MNQAKAEPHHLWSDLIDYFRRSNYDRSYMVCKVAYFLGGSIHGSWIFLFWFLDIWQLSLFNIFSSSFFFLLMWVNERGYRSLTISLASIELISHQVYAVYLLGLESNFQYFLILGLMAPYLALHTEVLLKSILSLASLIALLSLFFFMRETAPQIQLSSQVMTWLALLNIIGVAINVVTWTHYFNSVAGRAMKEAESERSRSDQLLRNILPAPVAQRLKGQPKIIADDYEHTSVLFADIVGFTRLASALSAKELVTILNQLFSSFDDLCEGYPIEKIKTLGDAYMVVSGLPQPCPHHAETLASFALDLLESVENFNTTSPIKIQLRVGIHSGPVVAGVIGKKKFIYDLWGDTVNTASRMQSTCLPGQIQVTKPVFDRIQNSFDCELRGMVEVKGKDEPLSAYWVLKRKAHPVAEPEAS
ncbi:adenylate/guanylate cyclase domain-containing protein [Pseudobacteriovorax antillogorgiicola]|uniref:Adenylate cyclase n=1 Tax=Pseudobacteriovorax antillogorgiicola TaxID=1513793 RepID=A0A1Y6BG15_9BACT|nr:adenylate/guanylate cyclase domain-containing protein [Pseudobacteriovorax antillogorgiicola]TCS57331.1 class 3 adenylate cyclase [Pseudobacteriovorax antillogorgiicola]SMF02411.1 Adenylate cyclase, class 3 [Pseudobacteriovorax antillogorgiicola]